MRAVVLLSGGLDSTVTAYIARQEASRIHTLFIDYGQKHLREGTSAFSTSKSLGAVAHTYLKVPMATLLGSSLLGKGEIPDKEEAGIPSTWVPQRNSIFLALAFGYAETIDADSVYIGVNSRDYSGYPDCRPEFIREMDIALNLASKRYNETGIGIKLSAPLQYLSKKEIIKRGTELGVDFSSTWSCYRGGTLACGRCPSCLIRLQAFQDLGMEDPLSYEKKRV